LRQPIECLRAEIARQLRPEYRVTTRPTEYWDQQGTAFDTEIVVHNADDFILIVARATGDAERDERLEDVLHRFTFEVWLVDEAAARLTVTSLGREPEAFIGDDRFTSHVLPELAIEMPHVFDR
jgi:hypothetical protein